MKNCIICKNEFKPRNTQQVVCSPVCRKIHFNNLEKIRRQNPEVKAKRAASHARWREENPDYLQRTKVQERYSLMHQVRTYGVTEEQAAEILKINYCQICGRGLKDGIKKIGTDHCHETGKVRGRLCDSHNRALGMFGDSVELLQSAIDYLDNGYMFEE